MYTVLLCSSCYIMSSLWIHMIHLTICFRVTSPTPGQSYDCPSVSEVALKDMGKINQYQTTYNIVQMGCIVYSLITLLAVNADVLCHNEPNENSW